MQSFRYVNMRILINTSNLRIGGGVQVADSIIRELHKYGEHHFTIVYPDALDGTICKLDPADNITTVRYSLPKEIMCIVTGRNRFLDNVVENNGIDVVLTIFGPSRWIPRVPHLCGFAVSHCLLNDSPYWSMLHGKNKIKQRIKIALLKVLFRRCSNLFYTENDYISKRLETAFNGVKVYTVSNTYNQCFDNVGDMDTSIKLPDFDGVTLLTISSYYLHKNLSIIRPLIRYLNERYPDFKCRFVLTIRKQDFPNLTELEESHIVFLGPIPVTQCPYLYKQADFMLMPTLLECFSASYAEAMKMDVPIITTDLGFAHSICQDAAVYYSPLNFEDLGDKLYSLAGDTARQNLLIQSGRRRLSVFDNYISRTCKLISILEKECGYSASYRR